MSIEDQLDERERAAQAQQARERTVELERAIDFGFQVQAFLDSDIGQRLMHDAETERQTLVDDYLRIDPDDRRKDARKREIRQRIFVLDHWQEAFTAYIKAGESAQAQYHEDGVTSETVGELQ